MSRPMSTRLFIADKVNKKTNKNKEQFNDLVEMDTDEQAEFFIKSFIFTLGDNFLDVSNLADKFKSYLSDKNESKDLNAVEASDFLQKNGKTRTAQERKAELNDVDINQDGRICFIEYLLLHYKIMILKDYFKRNGMKPTVELSNDGIGLVGVGDMLLDELFTMPVGLSEELEEAIENFMAEKKKREETVKSLTILSSGTGVAALRAKHQLHELHAKDMTSMNKLELTLAAAKRKAEKEDPARIVAAKKAEEERIKQEARDKSRQALEARKQSYAKTATKAA